MSDITITFTLPLSWLSFLTWSGFWVVYLYIGLTMLLGAVCEITSNAFGPHGDRIVRAWREYTWLPIVIMVALVAAWPAVIAWLTWKAWGSRW